MSCLFHSLPKSVKGTIPGGLELPIQTHTFKLVSFWEFWMTMATHPVIPYSPMHEGSLYLLPALGSFQLPVGLQMAEVGAPWWQGALTFVAREEEFLNDNQTLWTHVLIKIQPSKYATGFPSWWTLAQWPHYWEIKSSIGKIRSRVH